MTQKPDLSFWKLWNLSFGFFGVQIAYALQSANISRIFATLGADPHNLSYFWILPPLMGILVQPIVGTLSDKTWCRFGRRIPYLFVGATIAVLVMCLLPNAGSLGLTVSGAMLFGLIALMFLDTSINMAMQPFKMLVGDMVNEKQKAKAYSIQSFLCNAGSVAGYIFPFLFTFLGIKNVAEQGVVPDSVIWSFYVGAAILILCVIYTTMKVKEWNPQQYAEYNGVAGDVEKEEEGKADWITLLKNAPSTFWKVGLVQFFCWAGFLYLWNYSTGAIAETVWNTTDPKSAEFQEAGNWVGILFAVQAVGSVLWAVVLPQFKNTKMAYAVSLLCSHSIPSRPVLAVYPIPDDWCRLGSHVGNAFHLRYQCLAGLWSHGCLSGLVQWNYLYSSDCSSYLWWWRLESGRFSSERYDDCGWYFAYLWSFIG